MVHRCRGELRLDAPGDTAGFVERRLALVAGIVALLLVVLYIGAKMLSGPNGFSFC